MSILVLPPEVTRWAVARTGAQWEKKVAQALADGGVPSFLPLLTRVSIYSGKRRAVRVPVFPGYVFFSEDHFTGNAGVSRACRNRIHQVLRPSAPEQLRAELLEVEAFLRDHQIVQERLYGKPGQVVQVIGGPFRGHEGVIVRLKPNRRQLVLRISFLGAEFAVDEDQVAKA